MTMKMKWKPFKSECARIEPLLWEFASERLPLDKQARVATHLSQCAVCQAQLWTCRQIGQGLETLRAAEVPATQTHWSEVQARLTAGQVSLNAGPPAPQTAQTASRTAPLSAQSAGYSRLLNAVALKARRSRNPIHYPLSTIHCLVGSAAIAALALFCLRIVPHGGSGLQSSSSQDKDNRIAQNSKPAPAKQIKPSEQTRVALATGNGKTPFGRVNQPLVKQPLLVYGMVNPAFAQYGLKNEKLGLLVQSHPIAPDERLAKISFTSGDTTGRPAARWHSHRRFVGRSETLRPYSRGLTLARREPTGTQAAGTDTMAATSTVTPTMQQPLAASALPPEIPNYVLTVVEAQADQATPRAYVMDCVSSRPDRAPKDTLKQIGEEERVW